MDGTDLYDWYTHDLEIINRWLKKFLLCEKEKDKLQAYNSQLKEHNKQKLQQPGLSSFVV